MSRLSLIERATLAAIAFALVPLLLRAQNFSEVRPSPQQTQWQDLEFGAIIHFGTNTFLDREWGDGTADPNVFSPTQLNTDQWMQAVKSAGVTYVVFVAKHHDGFCLWPTEQTSYSVKSSPYKNGQGDIVKEVSDSARKFGLKFGVYLSPWDRHEPRYATPADYDKYYSAELDELAGNYGELTEFWLDGAGSAGHVYNFPHIIEELRTYQPNTLVFADTGLFEYGDIRWVGNERGTIPYDNWNVIDRHGYLRWRPVEVDTPLHTLHWFWHPNDERSLKSVAELTRIYEESIGRGGQLMLGLAPDKRGLLPEADVKRLAEFGTAVRARYSQNLVLGRTHTPNSESNRAAGEAALDGDPDTFWSAPVNSHNAILEVDFPKPVTFSRAVTMEWLNLGQHIQHYRIEIWNGKIWTSIAEGHPIGHKKIDIFPPVTTARVRLNILSSSSEARIREFQLFRPTPAAASALE
jgi:alpha-L-fucosidase